MRVLCSITPMEGAFAPVLPLLLALRERGHHVLVATAPDLADRVRQAGMDLVVAGPTAPDAAAQAMADPHFGAGREPWRIGAVMFARIMAPAKLPALRTVARAFCPDVVLHPPVDLAAPLLAAELGLPSVTWGTGLPLEPDLLRAMAGMVAPLWRASGLRPDDHAGLYRHVYLDPIPPGLAAERGAAASVAHPIRPSVPGQADDLLPVPPRSPGDRPLVYVSLGTVPIFNRPSAFGPLLAGLANLDVDVVVTVGPATDPAELGPLPRRMHACRWLSLGALLPRCDAVLCHAGAGTTLAALSHGLPLLLSPRGADQFPTAEACRRAGAARMITPDRLSPAEVATQMRCLLDGEHTASARRLSEQIQRLPSAEQVAMKLPELIAGGADAFVRPAER